MNNSKVSFIHYKENNNVYSKYLDAIRNCEIRNSIYVNTTIVCN